MTTIYYVDYEGAQGTGDGTSFANRAGDVQSLGTHTQYTPDGIDYEVRIKKAPTTTLAGCNVKKMGKWNFCGYDLCSIESSQGYWKFSTTKGQTGFRRPSYNAYLTETGDYIEINGNKWYYSNSNLGDGSSSQQMGNLLGLNGLWKVTVNGEWIYLDEYTGLFDKDENTSWSGTDANGVSYSVSTNNHGKWTNVSSVVIDVPNGCPIKEIASSSQEGTRKNWVKDDSNSSGYDYWFYHTSWSSYTWDGMPTGMDVFNVSSSAGAGTLIGHYELPGGAMDLSAYQGISFQWQLHSGWNQNFVQTPSATVHGKFSINLCSDTAGQTVVHKIPIDTRYHNRNGRGFVQWDAGTNLNTSIKSVALYKDYAYGSNVQVGFANIIAYKTAEGQTLHHCSKISAKTTQNPYWYQIKYIQEKAIKLLTSGRWWTEGYDETGYYSGWNNGAWDQHYTNINIYAETSYPMGVCNDHTAAMTNNNSQYNNNTWKNYWYGTFFGTPSGADSYSGQMAKVSGGWNRTDMSSKVTGDMTHFGNKGADQYAGLRETDSSVNHFVDFEDMSFHLYRINFYPQRSKIINLMFNIMAYTGYVGGNYSRGMGIRQWSYNWGSSSNVIQGSQQDFGVNQAGDKNDNYLYAWGHNSQDYMRLGYCGGGRKWKIMDFSGMHGYVKWESDSNMSQTDSRDQAHIYELYVHDSPNNSYLLNTEYLKDCHIYMYKGRFNGISIGNKSQVTIHDMDWLKLDWTTARHGGSWNNETAISWNSKNILLLGGQSDGRFYFYQNARIRGFNYTGSGDHYLNNEDREIMFADIGGVSGAGLYMRYYWKIEPESTIRHTSSGLAWKMTKSSSNASPIYELGKVAVAGSGTVTVKLWVYRTVTGTNTYALLRIPEDASLGITKSEMNSTNGAANTWYELTCTATPTAAGIMSVELELADNTNSGFIYFDDLSITQS